MESKSATDVNQWNWQWTSTFAVLIGYFVAAMLWIQGFELIAGAIGVLAAVLGAYVIYTG